MIKMITLFLFLSSITLRHVAAFAPRLSKEQLESFATNKSFAQSYAMELCKDMVNFWVEGTSYEFAYGSIDESVYSENSKMQVDGGKPIVGYNNMKADSYLMRNISQVTDINCTEMVYNDKSVFSNYTIHLKGQGNGGFRALGVMKETRFFKKYLFESDGTIKKVQYQTLSGRPISDFLNAAKSGARATLSAVQYIGLIEEQVEGSERNVELLTKLVYIIVVLCGVAIAGVVTYGINLCLSRYNKQKVKYDAVS
eukprot:230325_1